MKRMACLFVLLAMMGGRPNAQADQSRPDFSGTWKGPDGVLTIKRDGSTMTVTSGDKVKIYNLDGSESHFTGAASSQHAGQMTAVARWTGSALVVTVTTVSTMGTWEDLEVYSLDYGPKLTVVHVGTQTTRPMMSTHTNTYEKR